MLLDTRGFRGVNNNCFINCLMFTMFGYSKSPFFNIKQFPNKNSEIIFNFMMNLVSELYRDNLPDCTKLRNILPDNLKYGQQDASETYDFLMNLLNFEPIVYYTKMSYKTNNNIVKTIPPKKHKGAYINVANDGTENYKLADNTFFGKYEDLGINKDNWIKDDNGNPIYRYLANYISHVEGDTIPIIINRTNPIGQKYRNRVIIPDYIDINNEKYFRFGTILHIGNNNINHGHYITILWDGHDSHYKFDDSINHNKIKNNRIDYKSYKETIQRNCVMIFYYKF